MIPFDNFEEKEYGHIFSIWGKIYMQLECDLKLLHYLREYFVKLRA